MTSGSNASKQLSVSNSEGHGFHGNKCTILCLGSVNFQMLSHIQNFILLKSFEYIKNYTYLSALC